MLLALGGIAALVVYPISGRVLDALPIGFSNYSRFVAPWIEEAIKAVIVIGLFWFNRIGYKLDAVISGFAIGAGFSVVENIIYLRVYPDYGAGTWMVRGLGTAVMHGTTLAILAAIAHEFAERETRGGRQRLRLQHSGGSFPAISIAVGLHIAFNQFPERPMVAMLGSMLVAPVAIMAIFSFGTSEAQKWLAAERAAHRTQLDALGPADGPKVRSGRKIAALAGRVGSETAKRTAPLLASCRPGSSHEAEETMMEEAAGDAEYDRRRSRRVRRAQRAAEGARPEHLYRAEGAAAVQPQRLLGGLGAAPAGRAGQLSLSSCCGGRRRRPS